jgi:hypothetical protein
MIRPVSTRITLAAAAVIASLAAPVQANLLSNGSFEAAGPNLSGAGSYCYLGIGDFRECGSVPGWAGSMQVIASNSGPWHNPSAITGWNASQGARIAGLQNNSFLEQTLALSAGSYTLTWLDSNRSNGQYSGNSYDVRLDNTVLATYLTGVGDAWAGNSLRFNVTTTGSHTLRLQGLRTTGDGTSFVDMLSLAAAPNPVPEPASAGLVALALAGLVASRRRTA